jgi:hypothetical protein
MAQQNFNIPLHDIKPLVEVQEYSLYYLIGVSVIGLLIFAGLLYLVLRWLKHRNAFNIRKEHYKLLHALDFSDPKKAAYDVTFYGATFKDDGQRYSEMYKNLVERLEQYKYKKNVDNLDEEVMAYIDLYRGMIDV